MSVEPRTKHLHDLDVDQSLLTLYLFISSLMGWFPPLFSGRTEERRDVAVEEAQVRDKAGVQSRLNSYYTFINKCQCAMFLGIFGELNSSPAFAHCLDFFFF